MSQAESGGVAPFLSRYLARILTINVRIPLPHIALFLRDNEDIYLT
jgi:hypothetical protein